MRTLKIWSVLSEHVGALLVLFSRWTEFLKEYKIYPFTMLTQFISINEAFLSFQRKTIWVISMRIFWRYLKQENNSD